jgi:hypothetical protein
MISSNFRRLLLAIVAWPAGFLAAILALILKSVFSGCRGGEACALEDVSWGKLLLWLTIALGPGIAATYHWWTNRTRPNGGL